MAYNESRLERYLLYSGTHLHDPLARTLRSEAASLRLESFASFHRGRALYELPSGWPLVPAILR